jgi:hypothetical protein
MRMSTAGIACSLGVVSLLASGTARGEGVQVVPGQVELGTAGEVKALCGELKEKAVPGTIYVAKVPAKGFVLAPYDASTGRVSIDSKKALRGPGWELLAQGGLPLAVPTIGRDAAALIQASSEGSLSLWVWFRSAPIGGRSGQRCMTAYSAGEERQRLGMVPVAFAIERRGEVVAEGQTEEIAAMRTPEATRAEKVAVGTVMLADDRGVAPAAVTRAARGQEKALARCLGDAGTGTVVVGIELGAGGHVASARVELDGVGDSKLASCVTEVLRATSFPRKTRPARISVPVSFD